jgi:hypothetical protein
MSGGIKQKAFFLGVIAFLFYMWTKQRVKVKAKEKAWEVKEQMDGVRKAVKGRRKKTRTRTTEMAD